MNNPMMDQMYSYPINNNIMNNPMMNQMNMMNQNMNQINIMNNPMMNQMNMMNLMMMNYICK